MVVEMQLTMQLQSALQLQWQCARLAKLVSHCAIVSGVATNGVATRRESENTKLNLAKCFSECKNSDHITYLLPLQRLLALPLV